MGKSWQKEERKYKSSRPGENSKHEERERWSGMLFPPVDNNKHCTGLPKREETRLAIVLVRMRDDGNPRRRLGDQI